VWLQKKDTSGSLLQGKKNGVVVWDLEVQPVAQRLCVGGGFVVMTAGPELHVLSLASGRPTLPPMVLSSLPMGIDLSRDGRMLIAVCRDASISVWDLVACRCAAQTSLRDICAPAELDWFGTRAATGEPAVKLRSGRLLLFHRGMQRWMELNGLRGTTWLSNWNGSGEVGASANGAGPGVPPKQPRKVGEGFRLESNLMVAACIQDPQEFRERLAHLAQQLASEDPERLRSWCATLLSAGGGGGAAADAAGGGGALHAWFGDELKGMGLGGKTLLEEVVVPALGSVSTGQLLRAELEELLSKEGSRSVF